MKTISITSLITAGAALLLSLLAAPARADILYVTLGDPSIVKIASDGSSSVFASSGLFNPTGLAFDSAGNLYAVNQNSRSSTIEKFTSGGTASVFASSGLNGPWGLAFDSAGNLYAANVGNGSNTIEKFSATGTDLGVFANGVSGRFLAFTNDAGVPLPLANQAPEPASVALLGLGAVLLATRRRRETRD